MSHAETVRAPPSKSKFCGEREAGQLRHRARPESRTTSHSVVWRGEYDRNQAQTAENLGPFGSIRAPSSPRVAAYGLLPASGSEFFPRQTRLTRRNCLLTEEHAGVASRRRRLRIWRIFAQETNTKIVLLKIQPSSVVTVGGTAVT